MADSKITALTSISTSTDPANDPLVIVDVSDTSMAATGTTKKVTLNQLLGASGTATLASATITGDLTVDTSTLKVDSTNNRVGVGTASPSGIFHAANLGTAGTTADNFNGYFSSANRNCSIYLLAKNTEGSNFYFGDGDNNTIGGIIYDHTSNYMRFDANGSEQMRLNSTGLGIGTASPATKLHIDTLSAGYGLTLASSSLTGRRFQFGINIDANLAIYDTSAAAVRMIIDGSGNVGIGVTPSAGKGCLQLSSGINFPATQVASTDPNTLDDYEEGTWTGTLTGGTTNPTTPVTATGRYTKIGRVVTVQITFSNVDTTGASGLIGITGLPFANNGSSNSTGTVSLYLIATFTGNPFASIGINESFINFYANTSSGAFNDVTHNAGTPRFLNTSVTYTV